MINSWKRAAGYWPLSHLQASWKQV